jgi:hypothetical protein
MMGTLHFHLAQPHTVILCTGKWQGRYYAVSAVPQGASCHVKTEDPIPGYAERLLLDGLLFSVLILGARRLMKAGMGLAETKEA